MRVFIIKRLSGFLIMLFLIKRKTVFLDLEQKEEDPLLKQKEELHKTIEGAAPDRVQEMLRILTSAIPASESSNQ